MNGHFPHSGVNWDSVHIQNCSDVTCLAEPTQIGGKTIADIYTSMRTPQFG
jgi:hypothetical protein